MFRLSSGGYGSAMNRDRPVLGILLMLGFCVTAPLADALAKLLGGFIDVAQLVAIRMGLQVLLLLPVVIYASTPIDLGRRDFFLTAIRAVLRQLDYTGKDAKALGGVDDKIVGGPKFITEFSGG